MSSTEVNNESSRYLTFSLGKEHFAIPLLQVKEVIALPEVTPIPQAPAYFQGVMNLRGQVITIMDLRVKLGIKPVPSPETAVIICDLTPYCVGVVVDAVNSVLEAKSSEISMDFDLSVTKADSITGIHQKDNILTLILDISRTLSLSDQAAVKNAQPKAA